MRKLTLALSTAALALAGAAVAQTAPNADRPHRMPQADMTRAQAQAHAETLFARFDANKDGTIDQADRAAKKAQMFDRMDTDKNGAISRAEFDAMHADRGGKREGKMAHRGMRPGMQGGMRGHRGMMAGPMGEAKTPLTEQAFVARALTMFDQADANHDGTVTVAERMAAKEAMRTQWKARAAARQQG